MGNKRFNTLLKSDSGQSTVEYILLLAVVITFMTTIWNSAAFKSFMGEDSDFFNGIAEKLRIHYQFAANVPIGTETPDNPTLNHPSFNWQGSSRFFSYGGADPYPSSGGP